MLDNHRDKKMVVLHSQPLDNPDPPAVVILPLLKANPFPCSVSSLGHPGFFKGLDLSPCGKRTMSTRSLERATGKRQTSTGSRQRLSSHPTLLLQYYHIKGLIFNISKHNISLSIIIIINIKY